MTHWHTVVVVAVQVAAQTGEVAKEVVATAARPQEIGADAMAGVWIFFLQRAVKKLSAYGWFVSHMPGVDKWAHWTFAAVASLIAAEGIHVTGGWTAEGGGVYTIALPPLVAAGHAFVDWVRQFALQQFAYLVANRA